MGAPVVHFEIVHPEADRLRGFYADVFDWEIDTDNPMDYGMVDNKGEGINGGIGPAPDPDYPGHVTFYVAVSDPQATLDRVAELGGETVMPPTEVPGGDLIIAMFKDPSGNLIGLAKA
jgi:predicted enzyme related to lactoylglutathione lyase